MTQPKSQPNSLGLYALVLAAGSASRFGRSKQLAQIEGTPLVLRAAQTALSVCDAGVLVVTGADHADVLKALQKDGIRAIYNPVWQEGMGASLRQGVLGVPTNVTGLLILLADQPAITAEDLARLRTAWQSEPGRPAAAQYAGQTGVPAIFPAAWREKLLDSRGDQGARKLLRDGVSITLVPMENAAVDIDTPSDLERYLSSLS